MKALQAYIRINFLLIAILLQLPIMTFSQETVVKLYTVNDGLPSTTAHLTYQDKYGYLWISTPYGLSRFDGREFMNYGLSDGLPSLNCGYVFQDSRERLWISTAAGMAQFKNNRFITYPTSDSMDNLYVFHFFETKDKKLWAATGKGVYEFEGSGWKKLAINPGYENSMCRNIIEFQGELYICYHNDIFCKTKEDKWLHIASRKDGNFFNEMSLKNNQILISIDNSLYAISNHQLVLVFKNNTATNGFTNYLVDSKKRLWLAQENFLKISNPGDWLYFSEAKTMAYNYAFGLNEDSSHNIWISTGDGLLKIKDISYSIIEKSNNPPLDGIYNMTVLPDNRLIFSSGTKTGLSVYENNSFKQIMPPSSSGKEDYYRDPVDAFAFDEINSLWLITRFRKFLHFNGNTLEDFSDTLHLKTTEFIYDVAYIKSRNQFFVCADSTLLYGTPLKFSTFIPRNTGTPIFKPTRVYEIKNGLILLYIEKHGLYCVDSANNLISLNNQSGFYTDSKNDHAEISFLEGNDNDFWIAVPGVGLFEYGLSKNKLPFLKNRFTIKEGLQSNFVLSLTNDRQKRLWIATNSGVDILQKNKSGNWDVFNYATVNELSLSGSDYQRLATDTTGIIWLSSPKKILNFNPANIKLDKEPPHIIIEKVSLTFKETDWSKLTDSLYSYYELPYNPILKYNQNSFGILFNAIDLSISNSNPEYSYKLLPLDTSWSIPSKTKSVSFVQLPAGEYQFVVRAKDRASGWSQPASFRFTIKPPFWNEWWFRSIIIVVAAFIIIIFFKARIKKVENKAAIVAQLKELEMKALKAQMNPHFIYNALNSIQALVAADKKEEGIHYIGSFSKLLRQVLDNSEKNIISLDTELETIGLYIQLEALRLDMQLLYKQNIDDSIVAEFEKIPPLILQPFVENALWHGLSLKVGLKKIEINVNANNEWLICEITDNGIGRAKAQEWKTHSVVLHQSKAIDITRQRLIDFNEHDFVSPIEFLDLYDNNKAPAGTRVTIFIKRKNK